MFTFILNIYAAYVGYVITQNSIANPFGRILDWGPRGTRAGNCNLLVPLFFRGGRRRGES